MDQKTMHFPMFTPPYSVQITVFLRNSMYQYVKGVKIVNLCELRTACTARRELGFCFVFLLSDGFGETLIVTE